MPMFSTDNKDALFHELENFAEDFDSEQEMLSELFDVIKEFIDRLDHFYKESEKQ